MTEEQKRMAQDCAKVYEATGRAGEALVWSASPEKMSNERKPMLTVDDVRLAVGELSKREAVAAQWVIDRYERMIDEGKLRVVEAVELDSSIPGFLMCPKCQMDMRDDDWDGFEFCPCGIKIKRCASA